MADIVLIRTKAPKNPTEQAELLAMVEAEELAGNLVQTVDMATRAGINPRPTRPTNPA